LPLSFKGEGDYLAATNFLGEKKGVSISQPLPLGKGKGIKGIGLLKRGFASL